MKCEARKKKKQQIATHTHTHTRRVDTLMHNGTHLVDQTTRRECKRKSKRIKSLKWELVTVPVPVRRPLPPLRLRMKRLPKNRWYFEYKFEPFTTWRLFSGTLSTRSHSDVVTGLKLWWIRHENSYSSYRCPHAYVHTLSTLKSSAYAERRTIVANNKNQMAKWTKK